MIGGGDESIFVKINKGEKIYSNGSYFIAGETLEENKKRFEERELAVMGKEKKLYKKLHKKINSQD